MNTPVEPPEGLCVTGRRLWTTTLNSYDLDEHETLLLREACRTADLLDQLQEVIERDGPVLAWGDGTRANPAAVEARQQRLVLARLIAALAIPSVELGLSSAGSVSAIGAA